MDVTKETKKEDWFKLEQSLESEKIFSCLLLAYFHFLPYNTGNFYDLFYNF